MPWHEKITDAFGFCSAFCFICAFKMCAYGANRVVLWTISCLIFVLKRRFVIAENSSARQELESWMVSFKNGRLGVMRWIWAISVFVWSVMRIGKSVKSVKNKPCLLCIQAFSGTKTGFIWFANKSSLKSKGVFFYEKRCFRRWETKFLTAFFLYFVSLCCQTFLL